MLNVDYLVQLVSEAAKGNDNFKEGAVGFNGYGFVFRDYDYSSKDSFINDIGSSKLCSFGAFKNIYKKFLRNENKLLNYDSKLDLYFGGALKTLIPTLKFGGDEILFDVWMFVKTPKNQMFPATFYYGQSGTSIGGWSADYHLSTKGKTFPQNFKSLINFSPFNFSHNELEGFIEALEYSLKKVPVSDFEGIYVHDLGKNLMGIRSGKPFIEAFHLNHEKRTDTWSYCILGNDDAMLYLNKYVDITTKDVPHNIFKKYSQGLPDELYHELIKNSYDQLFDYAYNQKSRLAFLVLGVFLMLHKAKLTEELRQIILNYSDWKYEEKQLKKKEYRAERKYFLADFRKKIKEYDGTRRVKVPLYTVTRVINEKKAKGDSSPIWRQNIDYTIKE
ncbi:MAG: hypothetical protein ACFFA6_04480 [Promethearchaeota archaeon]